MVEYSPKILASEEKAITKSRKLGSFFFQSAAGSMSHSHREGCLLVSWCSEPWQPPGIISGLKEEDGNEKRQASSYMSLVIVMYFPSIPPPTPPPAVGSCGRRN